MKKTRAPELKSTLRKALAAIQHPEIQAHTLEDLGMFQSIQIVDGTVQVTLALPIQHSPVKETLQQLIQEAVRTVDPELQVEVSVTHMTPEQRAAFMAAARGTTHAEIGTRNVTRVIAVMSGKGGVGKSSVAGMLAVSLRRHGLRVGVLDADITGPSIPKIFGANGAPEYGPDGIMPIISSSGIKLMSVNFLLRDQETAVIWRGPLVSRAIEQFWNDIAWGDLDYLVVDLPPGTSDAALTVTQSLPLHGVILVTSPQDLAGLIVRKAADLVSKMEIPLIGVVENMTHVVCPHCGETIHVFGPSRAEEMSHLIGSELLGRLPLDPSLAVRCDAGEIEDYHNDAFEAVVDQVIQRLPVLADR